MITHRKSVEPLPVSKLEQMHTGSLLTRLQKLRECEEAFELTDLLKEEIEELKTDGLIHVKEQKEWKEAYADLKKILARREHIPRGKEKRELKNLNRGR